MATIQQMGLLNDALGDLSRTLLQNRLLSQQQTQQNARQKLDERMADLREKGVGIEEERAKKATEHERTMESKADATNEYHKGILQRQETQEAIKQLNTAYDTLQSAVDAGRMTPEEASARGRQAQQTIAAVGKLAFDNSKFGVVGLDFKRGQPVEPRSSKTPAGREVTWMPGSHAISVAPGPGEPTESIEYDPVTGEPLKRTVRGPLGRVNPAKLDDEMAGMETTPTITDKTDIMGELESGKLQPGWGPPGNPAAPAPAPATPAAPAGAQGPATYPNEAAARAAGMKSGDVVRLVINGKPVLVRLR